MVVFDRYTTLYPLIGGIVLAASVSLNLWLKGRITGVSGILSGIFTWDKESLRWKSSFIAGLVIAGVLAFDIFGFESESIVIFDNPGEYVEGISLLGWLIAGFAVGFGTKLGSGCTSGHGLCGIPRWSKRSFLAVSLFMIAGISIATLRYNYPFFTTPIWVDVAVNAPVVVIANAFLLIAVVIIVLNLVYNEYGIIGTTDVLVSAGTGLLFGIGLVISGMTRRSVVLGFLTLNEFWNPALLFVFCGALACNFVTFHFILKGDPVIAAKFDLPSKTEIDANLVIGAIIFGAGWGLAGLCPAPSLIGSLFYLPHVILFFITSLALGQVVAGWIISKEKKQEYEIIKDKE